MAKKVVYALVGVGLLSASIVAWWLQHQGSPQLHPKSAEGSSAAASAPRGAANPSSGARGGPPAVEVATVTTTRLAHDAQAVGSIQSIQSVVLRPEVSGRIVRLGFEEGRPVQAGQLMFQLEDSLQRAELSQAQAQLSMAQANLQRNRELLLQNFVSRRVVDESEATVQVAQAQVQLAQARLARTQVIAPFAGIAGIRQVSLGDYVREGADLVHIEDLTQLVVDFQLPERHLASIQVGQRVEVSLDALAGQSLKATIQAIDPQVDGNGRSLSIRAKLDHADSQNLRPGLFARVNVVFSVDDQAVVIPEEAVVPQGNQHIVWVVNRDSAQSNSPAQAQRVVVELGIRQGPMVQVLRGVNSGQTVVIAGHQRLQRETLPVRIVSLSAPRS